MGPLSLVVSVVVLVVSSFSFSVITIYLGSSYRNAPLLRDRITQTAHSLWIFMLNQCWIMYGKFASPVLIPEFGISDIVHRQSRASDHGMSRKGPSARILERRTLAACLNK